MIVGSCKGIELTKCFRSRKIDTFLVQTPPLSSLVPHVAGTKSDRVCETANFGFSATWRQGTADMSLAGSRRCRIEYPCQCVPYHINGDRRRLEEVLVGNKAVCCKGFEACSDVVSLHLQVPDRN